MHRDRTDMINAISKDARRTAGQLGQATLDSQVLAAVARAPRHEFVSERHRPHAYLNQPLPIGEGQTISQPFIVALMSDLAQVRPGHRVLEIGTGSGYQAAVLAELDAEVFSVEILKPLALEAQTRFARLGYRTIRVRLGDGGLGWPEHAPFDSILVTAAGPDIPKPLTDQLRPGGRLVIPIKAADGSETLVVLNKNLEGTLRRR
ncbi:MAG: protein-L-isoaspartate(D-aspartate) O-methyltransferase, partial [Acidobacteriota bacterium]